MAELEKDQGSFSQEAKIPTELETVDFATLISKLRQGVVRKAGVRGVVVDIEATDSFLSSVADILVATVNATRLPTIAPNTERLRADAANFMQHSTDDKCRRMCRVGVDDLAVLLAWVAQFPASGERK